MRLSHTTLLRHHCSTPVGDVQRLSLEAITCCPGPTRRRAGVVTGSVGRRIEGGAVERDGRFRCIRLVEGHEPKASRLARHLVEGGRPRRQQRRVPAGPETQATGTHCS